MKPTYLLAGILLLGMGCGKPEPKIVPTPESATYAIMDFNSQYTTLLSNDAVAIARCTGEVLDTGNHRGPICQKACTTGDLLIKFEQENSALMKLTNSTANKRLEWCPDVDRSVTH
jgi:hypothetical protein